MHIEFEISFTSIDPDDLRLKLMQSWFKKVRDKLLMRRCVYKHPTKPKAYARIRFEWDKITCTYKEVSDDNHIEWVKEIQCDISSFDAMKSIFDAMELKLKNYQETFRELRQNNEGWEVVIDWRPWLKPFCEIEWNSEQSVRDIVDKLWFIREDWLFGTVDQIYKKELWLDPDYINNLEYVTFENIPREKNKI